ncbi:hypothetical protein Tco_0083718 [Tanacetum coccineum]
MLQAEEQGELTIEERSKLFVELMDKRKKHFAKLRAEKIRRKPPTKAQKKNQINEEGEFICSYGSEKYYKIFSAMLDDFDRQDVLDLYRLVKERFEIASPKGYDKLLWGDLITLFEPSDEDEIWKAQQDYILISWRLFDSCGIYLLLTYTGITSHMLVERKYPLTQEMLLRMLSKRLEVDHECEMAYELLKFTRS